MDFKTYIMKPVVIANAVILICFILLPYFSMNMGPWGGVSKTGLGLFWTIFDSFSFLNLLLIAIPVLNGLILYKVWMKDESTFFIFKVIILAMLLILFLNIAFFAEKSSIKFVGFGLWLSLIFAAAQLFESKVVALINKQLPDDKKLEE